jgi:riboflavin synthase
MFTGIIQYHGVIESLERFESGARIRLHTNDPEPFVRGESLAVNGVCLTMMPDANGTLVTDLSNETLSRTTLGDLAPDSRVNVERALAIGDRLGGHMVQGHVDTTGTLLSIAAEGEFAIYRWSFPSEYAELVVSKGSIAVDGVSLTIVDPDAASFAVALIPETLRRTNLGTSRAGDRVNLEFDMVAKYIRNLAAPYLRKA